MTLLHHMYMCIFMYICMYVCLHALWLCMYAYVVCYVVHRRKKMHYILESYAKGDDEPANWMYFQCLGPNSGS